MCVWVSVCVWCGCYCVSKLFSITSIIYISVQTTPIAITTLVCSLLLYPSLSMAISILVFHLLTGAGIRCADVWFQLVSVQVRWLPLAFQTQAWALLCLSSAKLGRRDLSDKRVSSVAMGTPWTLPRPWSGTVLLVNTAPCCWKEKTASISSGVPNWVSICHSKPCVQIYDMEICKRVILVSEKRPCFQVLFMKR